MGKQRLVENGFCFKGKECEIEFDIMWGGYECFLCGKIGYLGANEDGKGVLYNDPKVANKATEEKDF